MPHATPGPPKTLLANPIIKQKPSPTRLGLC